MPKLLTLLTTFLVGIIFLSSSTNVLAQTASASLLFSPSQGTFEVGSTFDVAIVINTNNKSINAVKLDLTFPADKLQVVDPSAGTSFISLWVSQPSFSNSAGTASFEGGLPNPGINSSAAQVATIKFRAKSPGTAVLNISASSQLLANDGVGTNVLGTRGSASFNLTLPAPEGPIISSSTHPDVNVWYQDTNPSFSWELPNGQAELGTPSFSWQLDQLPNTIPDNTPDAGGSSTSYTDIASGIWYFHIKAKLGDNWGATSHFAVRLDTTPPASFRPEVISTENTGHNSYTVIFSTTDAHSGIDHYEVKIEDISGNLVSNQFFIEATSPWTIDQELAPGDYRVTVRAIDASGNYRDEVVEFSTNSNLLYLLQNRGVKIGAVLVPWLGVISCLTLIVLLILFFLYWRRRRDEEAKNPSLQLREYLKRIRARLSTRQQELKEAISADAALNAAITSELGDTNMPNLTTPSTDPIPVLPAPPTTDQHQLADQAPAQEVSNISNIR